MKNIFLIGCSHSVGLYNKKSDPKLSLGMLLAKHLPYYRIFNFSEYCNSIPNQFFTLHTLLKNSVIPDFIIIQWTNIERITYILNNNKLNLAYNISNVIQSKDIKNYYFHNKTGNAPNWSEPIDYSKYSIHYNCSGLNLLDDNNEFKKCFYILEKYGLGFLGHQSHLFANILVEHSRILCNQRHIPSLFYDINSKPNNNGLYSNLDFSITENFKEWKNFLHEDGWHLNNEGNLILIKKFILPPIKKYE